ncbi:MAG TPA: [protein-PII] uridylyltransferase [Acidimicrobiia bacterium]|nr:[protein-PII] uridylyltransferase [Acidimicrobiia bacterium]
MIVARLREACAEALADTSLRGRAYGEAVAAAVDQALVEVFESLSAPPNFALVGLGSYARRELCPASDVDVLLLHDLRGRKHADTVKTTAEALWYPLWDSGFVTGHGARTVKDSISLADEDLDALTALLNVRLIAGNETLAEELMAKARDLAKRRQTRVLTSLADAAELRRLRPGPVAEMLEPDLKEGAGGLRDVQSLEWGGWAFGAPGATSTLLERGYLTPPDLERVERGREFLLDTRVALQRVTGSRSDRLALQEQEAVASALGIDGADALIHELASLGRDIAWVTADVWRRVRDTVRGPSGRGGGHDEPLADGVVLREGRVHVRIDDDATIPAARTLEAAAAAAERDVPFDRASLQRLGATTAPTWDVWQRASFLRLLRAGDRAVPVFEALDHEGVLTALLPEWEHVRSRPQRNAYHRFTVDRHLLEAVAECARLLDAGDVDGATRTFDARVARACRRPELLLLSALLHDIAKGMPGDHSEVGAATAGRVARRIGLDSEGREILVWLVANHLLMADVATRRDLADAAVADNLAAQCAFDGERLRLLYLLTIGDSLATGPAAWSPAKASLVRDLFVKAAAAIEKGEATALAAERRTDLVAAIGAARTDAFLDRLPPTYALAFDAAHMAAHEEALAQVPTVRCDVDGGDVTVTVVAADRPGLLVLLAGALTVCGLDVLEASLFGTVDGVALDVFRAADPFGRAAENPDRIGKTIESALSGDIDLSERVHERRRAYASRDSSSAPLHIHVDAEASESDTVVEVHADDDVGLLYRLASSFADLGLDVRVAKVATLGSRVVDVFYVRDGDGNKINSDDDIDKLREALADAIAG